jgi:hypothetical protein
VRDEKSAQQVSRTILQNIKVLATGRNIQTGPTADGQPAANPTNNVTLLVTPRQAQGLQLASQGGRPWLILRSLRDGEEAKVDGTSMAEIRGDDLASGPGAHGDDPFGAAGRPGATTNPTTHPSEPAAPARQVWTMRVIRGGVPTEITFPIDPAREAREAAEREAEAQAQAQALAAAQAAQAQAQAQAQAAAQAAADAANQAAAAPAPVATPVPTTQPAVAEVVPAETPAAPVAPEVPTTRPSEPEVKTADLPTEDAIPAEPSDPTEPSEPSDETPDVRPDDAVADRAPEPPAAPELSKESDKPAEPGTPAEAGPGLPGADKPVTGTDTELKQELTK